MSETGEPTESGRHHSHSLAQRPFLAFFTSRIIFPDMELYLTQITCILITKSIIMKSICRGFPGEQDASCTFITAVKIPR